MAARFVAPPRWQMAVQAASDDIDFASDQFAHAAMGYGFAAGAVMVVGAGVGAYLRCKRLSGGTSWALGIATLVAQALWLLMLASIGATASPMASAADEDTARHNDDMLTLFYVVATSIALLWATSLVVAAVEGGSTTVVARVLWAVAGTICVLDLVLTWQEMSETYGHGGAWTTWKDVYRFSDCGGWCPVIAGSSWHRDLNPLSLPCSTPQVSPVAALIALLRGLFAAAIVILVQDRRVCSEFTPPPPTPTNTDPLLPADAAAPVQAPAKSSCCSSVGGIWTRTVLGVPALLGVFVLAAFLQPAITVAFIGRVLGVTCACMDPDLDSCTDLTLTAAQTTYWVAGKAFIGFLPPTLLAVVTGVAAWRARGNTAAAAAIVGLALVAA